MGDDPGQRGKALGLAAFDLGGRPLYHVARLAQLGAVVLRGQQCRRFVGRQPVGRYLQIGQGRARRRVIEVAREARQRIQPLRLQRVLLGQCTGLARSRAAQVIAAHGAQFGTPLLDMRQLADDGGRFGRHLGLALEAVQLEQGGQGFQQHVLAGAVEHAVLRGFHFLGRAYARANGAAVEQAHAHFGIDGGIGLTALALGNRCRARRGAGLETGPACALGGIQVMACGLERRARLEHIGMRIEHLVKCLQQLSLRLVVGQRTRAQLGRQLQGQGAWRLRRRYGHRRGRSRIGSLR